MKQHANTIRALAGLLVVDVVVYLMSAYYVNVFYANNPPHFDSIGPLTLMFQYINLVESDGIGAAWAFARQHDSVSWVQGAYAVLLAPVLPRTPAAMMSLNFVCLFAAQAALFDLGRSFGATRLQAFGFGLLPLMPAMLHGHYGTYQDMRRDASFLSLLLASFCLSLSYLKRPTTMRGVLLGAAAGVTQWARGNALPYTFFTLLPAAAWATTRYVPRRRWRELARVVITPLIPFLAFSVSYYQVSLNGLLSKYIYETPDLNSSRLESLAHFGLAPVVLMFGNPGRLFWIKLGFVMATGAAILVVGPRLREVDWQPRRGWTGDRRWLAIGGAVVLAGIIVLVTLIVGVAAIAGYAPSYAGLIGLFSLLMALSLSISFRDGWLPARNKRLLAVAAALLFTFANSVDTLRLGTYPRNIAAVRTAQELTPILRELARSHKVTWMWDGSLNYWVFNYYLTQAGEKPIEFYYPVSPDRLPSPDFGETVESRAAEVKAALLSADVLVLSDTPGAYAGILGPGFFDTYGYLIVPDILADPRFQQIHEFESDGYHFVILQRTE